MANKMQGTSGTSRGYKTGLPCGAVILLCIVIIMPVLALSGDETGNDTANTTAGDTFSQAPFNPAFLNYMAELHPVKTLLRSSAAVTTATQEHSLGLVPSPVWRPEVSDISMSGSGTGSTSTSYSTGSGIPADARNSTKFDLRTYGKVSPVKDQTYFGTCWAFASLASLESTLMPVTPTPDFSEKNLANLAGFDLAIPDGGGQVWMAAAYLTRWNGPVDEATDPYPSGNTWSSSGTYPPVKYIQNIIIFPLRTDRTNTENMKYGLTTWGAAATGFYWNDSFYNNTYASYYEPATVSNPVPGGGHFVTIVGWDDTYAAGNFTNIPDGPGAWIAKNSWGTGWGDSGYFYVSYYDKYFASAEDSLTGSYYDSAVIFGENTSDYNAIYSYDRLGDISDYSYNANKTGSFASVYNVTTPGTLSAVGFYTTDMDVPCTIIIYKNPSSGPVGNTPVAQFSTTLPSMGYNTVKIPDGQQVALTPGDRFSVAVEVTNPENDHYIPTEINSPGYSSGVVSGAGQSYVLGSSGWVDWKTVVTERGIYNSNICLKAYTSETVTPAETSDSGSDSSGVGGSTAATVSGVVAGQPATFSFDQNPSVTAPVALDTVQITFSRSPGTVEVTGLPVTSGGSAPGQAVAGYFQIEPVGINENAVGEGVITFSVNRQWLLSHDLDPADVVLMRNHDTQWSTLPTTFLGLDGDDTYSYRATTPGFLYFAVVVNANEPAVAINSTEVTQSPTSASAQTITAVTTGSATPQITRTARQIATTMPVTSATTMIPSAPASPKGISVWTIAILICIVLVIIGGGLLLRRWWIRRQNPALFRKYD
ncbi:MAG: lectin like domain-containing protein [Methanoregula sp.]|jgi:PGF-pre-PGF domain-containing protein